MGGIRIIDADFGYSDFAQSRRWIENRSELLLNYVCNYLFPNLARWYNPGGSILAGGC